MKVNFICDKYIYNYNTLIDDGLSGESVKSQ